MLVKYVFLSYNYLNENRVRHKVIGTIIYIDEYGIRVKLSFDIYESKSLLNSFVLIRDDGLEIFGEIKKIEDNIAHIQFIGEFRDNLVIYGVSKMPAFSAQVYLVSKEFIPNILGDKSGVGQLLLGKSTMYSSRVHVAFDTFFGNHFAIFGSTGSGKSCGLARIIQNIFIPNPPKNAKIIIFDAYGEYRSAFSGFANGVYKAYTTDTGSRDDILKIPLWLLTKDDIALLLSANKSSQLLIIDKALRFVNVFKREGLEAEKYKNSVIASALLEILSSGRTPVRIRDQVLAILARYNTNELNTDTKIVQPGYTRTLKQCMMIDGSGKINAIELVENKLEEYVIKDIDLSLPDGTFKYTLTDFLDSLDFALIDEGVWKSEDTYDAINFLKVRLQNLIKNDYSHYFDMDYVTIEEFINGLFKNNLGSNAEIVNFNISFIDDSFCKTVVKIYSKLIFDYLKSLDNRATMPINIILEEAHRYVQNDSDVDVIGYNIFERICKEGRKYGLLMGFISQRPTELSETCISQCSNYLIFKMTHAKDLDFIRGSVPYITDEMIEKIKSLAPGSSLAFGSAFNIPIAVDFMMPSPAPASESAKIYDRWYS